ncbi:MAG: hypothetical protein KAT06_08530 [Gammaproteobacteria bacterium]|nr:hypothetical protein [Gammaproteobacteria bacterium]
MSNSNDTNLMTGFQVKRQLKSVNTDKPDIKNSLLSIVDQFQCLDHIAKSIGLIKDGFPFVNRVSWKTVLSNLEKSNEGENKAENIKLNDIVETITRSSDQLENELIPQLQKWRNNWMLEVILIDFVLLALLVFLIAGVTHTQGVWALSNINISILPFLYERPVFSLVAGIIIFISFFVMHFTIRNFVANRLAMKLKKEPSEFDFANAFLKNTRIQHSIFRPDIIGWNWLSRKCLLKNRHAE